MEGTTLKDYGPRRKKSAFAVMASMQGSLEYQSYYLNMLYFLKARIAIRKKLKTAESIYSVSNQH